MSSDIEPEEANDEKSQFFLLRPDSKARNVVGIFFWK